MSTYSRMGKEIFADKNVYCYGAGDCFVRLQERISKAVNLCGVIDIDEIKWGQMISGVRCYSLDEIELNEKTVILITVDSSTAVYKIKKMLEAKGIRTYVHISDFYESVLLKEDKKQRRIQSEAYPKKVISYKSKEISAEDITFVITGKMDYVSDYSVDKCVGSIRDHYAGASIILSTWEEEEVLPVMQVCNLIMKHSMPKEYYDIYTDKSKNRKLNTVNMQQLLVSEGLKKVKTPYAVRMRSDFSFRNDNCLTYYKYWSDRLELRDVTEVVFEERIMSLDTFIYNPWVFSGANAYTLSDCFMFGRTEDLRLVWDGHREMADNLDYHKKNAYKEEDNPHDFSYRFSPEQCLLLNVIKQKGMNWHLPDYYYERGNVSVVRDYERFIASNLIIGNHRDLGLKSRFTDIYSYYLYEKEDVEDIYDSYVVAECNEREGDL